MGCRAASFPTDIEPDRKGTGCYLAAEEQGAVRENLPVGRPEGSRGRGCVRTSLIFFVVVCAKVVTENIASRPTTKVFFVIIIDLNL